MMINKIKNLFKKAKKIEDESTDLNAEDFTKDIPIESSDEEQIDLNKKLSFKDKSYLLKTKIKDKFTKFKIKKQNSIKQQKSKPSKSKSKGSFDLGRWVLSLLSENKRNNIHRFSQISFFTLALLFVGFLISSLIQGPLDLKNIAVNKIVSIDNSQELKVKSLDEIKRAQVFYTVKEEKKTNNTDEVEKKPKKELVCDKADKKSRLPIKLINTVVLQDELKSVASVQVRSDNKFKELRVGDEIPNMAKVSKIERLRIIVKNLKSETCESIESDKKERETKSPIQIANKSQTNNFYKKKKDISGIKNVGNTFDIDKNFLQEKMKDISVIITQARGIQINNPDGTISFKVTDIEPGSVYDYLGIRDGDIIEGIGGEKITDLNMIMSLFGKLTTISNTSLDLKRGGSSVTQKYRIQ